MTSLRECDEEGGILPSKPGIVSPFALYAIVTQTPRVCGHVLFILTYDPSLPWGPVGDTVALIGEVSLQDPLTLCSSLDQGAAASSQKQRIPSRPSHVPVPFFCGDQGVSCVLRGAEREAAVGAVGAAGPG